MALNFNRVPGPGETRACTDPWKFVIVRSSGEVSLCCRSVVVGNLKERPLDSILMSPAAVRMRERLLVGDLPQDCITCSERGVTTLDGLRRDVEHVLFEESLEELEDLRRQVYEHREVRSELMRQDKLLRGHAEELGSDLHRLAAHAEELGNERDRLATHAAKLEAERPQLCSQVENLDRERGELVAERDRLQSHLLHLEEERLHLTGHVANLEREASVPLPRLIARRLRGWLRRLAGRA